MATTNTTRNTTPKQRSARAKSAAASRKRTAARSTAATTRGSAKRTTRNARTTAATTGQSARRTARSARTTAKNAAATASTYADAQTTALETLGIHAQRAVLIPVGAAAIARDRISDFAISVRTPSQAQRTLKRYERRGTQLQNRLVRRLKRTRKDLGRSLPF